jgi:hypothetical protein
LEPAFGLTQDHNDLRFGRSSLLFSDLFGDDIEEILIPNPLQKGVIPGHLLSSSLPVSGVLLPNKHDARQADLKLATWPGLCAVDVRLQLPYK